MDEQDKMRPDGEEVKVLKVQTKPKTTRKPKKTKKSSNKSRKTDKETEKVDKPVHKTDTVVVKPKPIPILENDLKARVFYLRKKIAFCPNQQLKESYEKQLEKTLDRPIISY